VSALMNKKKRDWKTDGEDVCCLKTVEGRETNDDIDSKKGKKWNRQFPEEDRSMKKKVG